jgi:hypothetical protein
MMDIGIWHFKLIPLIAGLLIGWVVAHFYKPEKKVVHQYPHPSDAIEKIYRDHNNTCYSYESHEVDCDANEATLQDYPLQA